MCVFTCVCALQETFITPDFKWIINISVAMNVLKYWNAYTLLLIWYKVYGANMTLIVIIKCVGIFFKIWMTSCQIIEIFQNNFKTRLLSVIT